MRLDLLLQDKINSAKMGREYWLNLDKEYKIDAETYVVVFPDRGTKVNEYVLKYLPSFVDKVHSKRIILLSSDTDIIKKQSEDVEYIAVYCEEEKIDALLSYYTLQMFTERIVIASLDKPEGRNGKNVIGINGITEEEAVAIGILGLKEVK